LPGPYKNPAEIVVWNCPETRGFPSSPMLRHQQVLWDEIWGICNLKHKLLWRS
jgi:hypothetical protein